MDSSANKVDSGPLGYGDLRPIGSGSEGGAYFARELATGARVVVKPVMNQEEAQVRRAFTLLRTLASPYLPGIRALARDRTGALWWVSDWAPGESLSAGPVPVSQAVSEGLSMARALATIHRTGLHHGDVSLANVVCNREGGLVLVDLAGLGRQGAGTPGFIAPEVLAGGGAAPADYFALGAVLCARLWGEVPWRRPEELLRVQGRRGVQARLQVLCPGRTVPAEVVAVVAGLLDPDPQARLCGPEALERLERLGQELADTPQLQPEIRWHVPRRWPYRGLELAEQVTTWSTTGWPRLILIAGPRHSGRGRAVEEIIGRCQGLGSSAAVLCEPDTLGASLEARGLGGGEAEVDWIAHWLAATADTVIGLRSLAEPTTDVEMDRLAAQLRAAAALASATILIPVSSSLAGRVVDGADPDAPAPIIRLSTAPWSREALARVLDGAMDGGDALGWAEGILRACGGWSGRSIRVVEACARLGVENSQGPEFEGALVLHEQDPPMDTDEAREVLAALWSGDGALSGRLWGDLCGPAGPTQAALLRARSRLGGSGIQQWAREWGRRGIGERTLQWAVDADDPAAIAKILTGAPTPPRDPGVVAWLAWLAADSGRGNPEQWVRGARLHLARGEAQGALELAQRPGAGPAGDLEAIRALIRLGRLSEALAQGTALADQQTPAVAPDIAATACGLVLRALVDLGDAEQARARLAQTPSPAVPGPGAAAYHLWAAYAEMAAGAVEQAEQQLTQGIVALRGVSDADAAGLRARILQLQGNLAHQRGDLPAAHEMWTAAAEAFARAGEPVGALPLRGSLAALCVLSFEGEAGLEHARAAVRGLLARGQFDALAPAVLNLVQLAVRHGRLSEGYAALAVLRTLNGMPSAGLAVRARYDRALVELEAAHSESRDAREQARSLAQALATSARLLGAAGLTAEAAEGHLRAAAQARRGRDFDRAAAELAAARSSPGGDPWNVASAQLELTAARGEAADIQTQLGRLGHDARPAEWIELGQLERCWGLSRAIWTALAVLYPRRHPLRRRGARAVASVLETIMTKTPTVDRAAVRRSLWADGEVHALAELVEELGHAQAAEHGRMDVLAGGREDRAEASPRGERSMEGSERLLRMYRRLAREDRLQPLLEQVIDAVMELTEAERGAMVVLDAFGGRTEVTREISASGEGVVFSHSIIDQVLATGDPVLSVDAAADDRFDSSRSISHLNLRSVLAAPLSFRGEILGAVYVDHRLRRGNFDESDLGRLEAFAELAALAVAHTRALEGLRRQAQTLEQQAAQLAELLAAREVEVASLRARVEPVAHPGDRYGLIGSSPALRRICALIERLGDHMAPVWIHGESGTGKELVAKAIHQAGLRKHGPFVAENCGAIPESLLESQLFGHAKGAFTGADKARPGLFEAAGGGTIFLDEVGEMSPAMQTKLLRVLQEGEVRRLGETTPRKVDVRVIAASNRDLERLVAAKGFRQDLYYRIAVVRMDLPPLRERIGDLPELIAHLLARHGAANKVLTTRALRALAAYAWPGNVRELDNEVQRWIALCDGAVDVQDLCPAIRGVPTGIDPEDLRIRPRVERLERELITEAMSKANHNQTRAAELLGLSRFGLQKKLRKLEEEG